VPTTPAAQPVGDRFPRDHRRAPTRTPAGTPTRPPPARPPANPGSPRECADLRGRCL